MRRLDTAHAKQMLVLWTYPLLRVSLLLAFVGAGAWLYDQSRDWAKWLFWSGLLGFNLALATRRFIETRGGDWQPRPRSPLAATPGPVADPRFGIALRGMIHLLRAVGERHWQSVIEEHLETWNHTGDTSRHFAVYGGMGSFNDLWLLRANQHRVTEEQEPWANALREGLIAVAVAIAQDNWLRFYGFGRPENARLSGVHCDGCSYEGTTRYLVDGFLSQALLAPLIAEGLRAGDLEPVVDAVLRLDIPGLPEGRAASRDKARASGIDVRTDCQFIRTCPRCSSTRLESKRWTATDTGFAPERQHPGNLLAIWDVFKLFLYGP